MLAEFFAIRHWPAHKFISIIRGLTGFGYVFATGGKNEPQ